MESDSTHESHGSMLTAEEASSKRELVKKIIKSILCSSKDGLTEQELRYEYRIFTNEAIPFTQLGCKSAYELVKDMNIANISRLVTGQYVFHPIYDNDTHDLGALVVNQIDRDKPNREIRRMREGLRVRNHLYPNRFGAMSFVFGPSAAYRNNMTTSTTTMMSSASVASCGIQPFVTSNVQKNIQTVLEAQPDQTLPIKDFQLGNQLFFYPTFYSTPVKFKFVFLI